MPQIARTSFRGFTLTELMISIALVLLLIVGVNVVFQATSDTLSAGQKIAQANRNEQALHTVLAEDLRNIVMPPEAPFLIIRSRREAGFLDQLDMLGDEDYNAASTNANAVDAAIRSYDVDGDGSDESFSPAAYNRRNHRVDTIFFFARGLYQRQTGTTALVDAMSAREAFIWYGHVQQPVPATLAGPPTFRGLGADYEGVVRGRAYPPDPTSPLTRDTNPTNFFVQDWTLGRMAILMAPGHDATADGIVDAVYPGTPQAFLKRWRAEAVFPNLAPFSITSQTSDNNTGGPYIFYSRYDLAAMTIDQYRWIVANNWLNEPAWWWPGRNYFDYRFQYSSIYKRPLDPDEAARTVPGLLRGASQFIVEFAGDFFTQNSAGEIVDFGPDGTTDFIQNAAGDRIIRWYGLPRDSNNDGAFDLLDVLPVALVASANGASALPDPWFEAIDPPLPPLPTGNLANMDPRTTYVAAWGEHSVGLGRPTMLRFIVGTVPTSPNADERIAEYVFNLK